MRITSDLAEIFRKNNEKRTEDALVQKEVLERKTELLTQRGGWQPGWDMLRKEGVAVPKRSASSSNLNYLSHTPREELTYKAKERCVSKIHRTNKIKEQFMKIKSECVKCTCYEDFDKFTASEARQTMSNFTRTAYRTAEGWGRASSRASEGRQEQPLEAVYNQMKFLSDKSKERYNHNIHLLTCRRNKDKLERRKSAPVL